MIAAVVGWGAIGKRHARVLESLVDEVVVVSRRSESLSPTGRDIGALVAERSVDYVVVATETSDHHAQLTSLTASGFTGRVMVEKPIFDSVLPVPENDFSGLWVGYNLRFHPLIQVLRAWALDSEPLGAVVEIGSYLPAWRERDHGQTYSAWRSSGGGVLRDLSHELDYAQWILGRLSLEAGVASCTGSLDGDAEDLAAGFCRGSSGEFLAFYMSFSDRIETRRVRVVAPGTVAEADLIGETLNVDGEVREYRCDRDDTYRRMHRAALQGEDLDSLCDAGQALDTLRLIEALELRSSAD